MAEQTLKLNQAREQIIKALAQRLDKDYKTLTIAELRTLKRSIQHTAERNQTEMTELLRKLSARNEINKKLIENAIKFWILSIQLLTGRTPHHQRMEKAGWSFIKQQRSMFDYKY